jgi:cytoskeleton-associated protein 5
MVDQEPSDQRVKYAELVMKCLWKLTKSLKQTLEQKALDVSDLLSELHKFFMASPPSEWKRRAADKLPLGDMPLRTVKTILHELCMGVGSGILKHLINSSIADPGKSIVGSYLNMMLQSSGSIPADSPIKEVAGSVGVAVAKDLTNVELNLAVEHIFKKISSKDQAEEVNIFAALRLL